jgi:GNAT superfamily N-acetyltransferase
VRIRDSEVDDARGIARAYRDAFVSEHTQMGDRHPCGKGAMAEEFATGYFAARVRLYRKDGCLLVADEDGGVSGFVIASAHERLIQETEGEIEGLGVLEARRRRGFGMQLVVQAARRLAELGMRSIKVRVWVPSEANLFYAALAGERGDVFRARCGDSTPLEHVIYRWEDIRQLAGARARGRA